MGLLMRNIALALMCLFASTAVTAQESGSLDDGAGPPPATIADLAWLAGRWEGAGIGGAIAVESWLPPLGDTMVGTFVQADGAGGVMFSEHMHVVSHNGSLELRLKHFNGDLTGWEDKEGMVRFPLVTLGHCAAHFDGLAMQCEGENGLRIAVRMAEAGEVSELVFHFTRAQ